MGAELFRTAGGLTAGVLVLGVLGGRTARRAGALGARFSRASTRLPVVIRAAVLGVFAAILATACSAGAAEDKRVALVIGNGAYLNAPRLDNPAFDARAVADAFRKLGFQVVDGYDLDIAQMRAKVSEFSAALPDARSAVIYYAGHGISVDEENYLIPTDIVLKSPTDLDLGAISVSLLLKQMKREDRVNVVILDACRDNPFATALAKAKTRAMVGERGLSRIDGDLARGTLIAFASDPKSTALDGATGQHSPFTEAFLDHVFDSGVSIDLVMSRVRTEVWEKTRHNQLPWVNTSLIGDYALNPEPSPQAAADAEKAATPAATAGRAADNRQTQEDLLWESAQHSNLSADYQAYLDAFPSGVFAQMAKNRIANLAASASPLPVQTQQSSPPAQVQQSPAPAQVPQKVAVAEPAAATEAVSPEAVSPAKDWKAESGTAESDKALNLTPADQKEIQQRLIALGLYKGPATDALDAPTRSAVVEWQKSRGVAATSFLAPLQLAELREESESAYQKLLAAQSAPRQAPKQAAKPATVKAPKKAAREATRAAKAPERHRAQNSSAPQAAASAPPAVVPPSGMSPQELWIRRRHDAWQWVQ